MSRKVKTIILIIIGFLLSLFLFQLFIGCGTSKRFYDKKYDMFVAVFTPVIDAGVYHFIFISIIAILVRFTKIDNFYKKIFTYLPVYTVVFSFPMSTFAFEFAKYFNLFGYDVLT